MASYVRGSSRATVRRAGYTEGCDASAAGCVAVATLGCWQASSINVPLDRATDADVRTHQCDAAFAGVTNLTEYLQRSTKRIMMIDGAMGTMVQVGRSRARNSILYRSRLTRAAPRRAVQKRKLEEEDFRGERFKNHHKDLKGDNDLLTLTRGERAILRCATRPRRAPAPPRRPLRPAPAAGRHR